MDVRVRVHEGVYVYARGVSYDGRMCMCVYWSTEIRMLCFLGRYVGWWDIGTRMGAVIKLCRPNVVFGL